VSAVRDRGSAMVEFIAFAVVAMVPLAYAALALQQLVGVHAATQAAAGESVRAFLTSHSQPEGMRRADVAAALALEGSPAVTAHEVSVTCAEAGCLKPGAAVRVQVQVQAKLPQIPVLGIVPSLTTTAEQYGVVDAYAAVG